VGSVKPPVRAALAAAALLAAPASALAAAVDIAPTVALTSFQARVSTQDGSAFLTWGGPDRFATSGLRGSQPPFERTVSNRGLQTSLLGTGGAIVRRAFAAAPDGFSAIDLIDLSVDTLLARARAGRTTLASGHVGSRATLRGTVRLGANDCAGLRGGTRTIDLDAATLLPVRVVTRRSGAPTQTLQLLGLRLDSPLAATAFAPLRPGGSVFRDDQGFRRAGAAAAARNLPYVPELPGAVPAGFTLAVSGWAPRGAIIGAEGSIPARPSLFAAVYARGWERIEITQRRSLGTDWPDDPFASECQPLTAVPVKVGAITATYALDGQTEPHLFWRDGAVLHTVSGPFPAPDLVAVAESLAPVSAP